MASTIESIGCTIGNGTSDFCHNIVQTRTNPIELQCSGFNLPVGNNPPTEMNVNQIYSYWTRNGDLCRSNYGSIIFSSNPRDFQPQEYVRVQQDMTYLLSRVFGTNASTFSTTVNTGLQLEMFYTCNDQVNMYGSCEPWIYSILVDKYSDYDTMAVNPALSDWVSCYIPPNNEEQLYQSFSTPPTTPDGARGNAPCWPMCHRVSTIQLFQPNTGDLYQCSSNVCVIDDVTISENNSQGGNVNINQICGQCNPDQLCECIISSSDMPEAFAELGINATYTSYCGSGICYVLDNNGILTPTDCTSYLGTGGGKAFSSSLPWIIFVIVIFVFLIFIGVFLALRKPKYIKTVPTEFTLPEVEGGSQLHSWKI